MSEQFFAEALTRDASLELELRQPNNPFATAAYFRAKANLGFDVWIAGVRNSDSAITNGCGLFFKRGSLNHSLEIVSLPDFPPESAFWSGLRDLCTHKGVTLLALGSYASESGTRIPSFGELEVRRDRCEYVLDLRVDPASQLRSNHRRNVKKAQQLGMAMASSRSTDALNAHLSLINQSMLRRRARGESVSTVTQPVDRFAFLESRAGELFQAVLDDDVLSSVLVLHAFSGSYYQSAGTTPEGMACGASHFLVHSISNHLRDQGATTFGLGGAEPGSTLARFKSDFGAVQVPLQALTCHVGPEWKRRTSQAVAVTRSLRNRLWSRQRSD